MTYNIRMNAKINRYIVRHAIDEHGTNLIEVQYKTNKLKVRPIDSDYDNIVSRFEDFYRDIDEMFRLRDKG